MIDALAHIATSLGLSSAAGLNAYLPLLVVALVARFTHWITLKEPYDLLTNEGVIATLVVLLIIEVVIDKIPAIDTINDTIQTFVRPVAGAILFAANSNVIGDVHPALALICGLVLASGVHAAKATTRPVVTGISGGLLNPLVSFLEDILSAIITMLSILVPALIALLLLIVLLLIGRWCWRRWQRRATAS